VAPQLNFRGEARMAESVRDTAHLLLSNASLRLSGPTYYL
jgi:hypothetical protein